MTRAKHNQAKMAVRDTLKRHGLRYSRPREAILEFFMERDKHTNAEGLYLALKKRGEQHSLSTVYLNLGVLTEAGLIREFHGLQGESLFDSNVLPHHHLICKDCGAIQDLPQITIEGAAIQTYTQQQAAEASGWQIDAPRLELHGMCPKCQNK